MSQVTLSGTRDYEISIEVSEEKLRQYNLTFDQVARAVRNSPKLRGLELQAQLREIRTAINYYFAEQGELPTEREGLHPLADAGLIDARKLVDPWGHPLLYRIEEGPETTFLRETSVHVWSAGPNGIPDDGDDIGLR